MRKARYGYRVQEQQAPTGDDGAVTEGEAKGAGTTTTDPPTPAAIAPTAPTGTAAAPTAPTKVVIWEPAPVDSCLAMIVSRLQQMLTPELKSYKLARLEDAKSLLLAATAKLLQEHPTDADAACAALKQLRLGSDSQCPSKAASTDGTDGASMGVTPAPSATLLSHTFVLQRKDIPSVLEQLGATCSTSKQEQTDTMQTDTAEPAPADVAVTVTATTGAVNPSMLQALVIGDWCTQGAQVLRRSVLVQQLCLQFGSTCDDLVAAIKAQEVCLLTARPNRHGHTEKMPYPGAAGWSPEYAAERLAGVAGRMENKRKKVMKGLEDMRRFTVMANWAKAAATGPEQLEAVCGALAGEADAHRFNNCLGQLQGILGQQMPAEVLMSPADPQSEEV